MAILLLGITISGCKKDNTTDGGAVTHDNFLAFNKSRFDLSKGRFIKIPYDDSLNYIMLELFSPGIIIHENIGSFDTLSGKGQAIIFSLYSKGMENIPVGEFTISDTTNSNPEVTLEYSAYNINWNVDQDPDADFPFIFAGTLKVIKHGEEYELSFSGHDMIDNKISCYYKGSMIADDFYGNKKSQKNNLNGK